MGKGEPPKKSQGSGVDTSNLITTRSAAGGSAYEKALAPDTEGLNTPSYGSRKQQKGEETAMNETEAIAYVQRVAGVDEATAKELNEAIWKWTNGSYYLIRAVQQGNTGYMDKAQIEKYRKMGEDVEKYIQRAAKWGGGVTYRGIGVPDTGYKVGDKIDMKGTASWSTREGVAQSFAGYKGSVFVSNTQSWGTSTNFSHQHHSEHEVTVSKKANYIVDRIVKKDKRTYYYVHEA